MNEITGKIRAEMYLQQDQKYRDFQIKLIPTVDPENVIGVRTPILRKMAKEYCRKEGIDAFLQELPHMYFDENQLHAFLLSEIRDYDDCITKTEQFLPFIDNWATCDQLSPKVFRKHRQDLLCHIRKWLSSGHTYTIRFAIGMLMQHFLDEDFDREYPEMVAGIRSDEYYVNMMIAWYFATALAKQYEAAIRYLKEGRLDIWTHNKTIRKAIESYRITPGQKEYLRSLKQTDTDGSQNKAAVNRTR